jgi:ABC-2 type transport system permease protein
VAAIHSGFGASFSQMISQVRIDLFSTIRSTVFIVIVVFALVNTGAALLLSAGEGFGLSSLPVTYQMIDLIRGSMYLFLVAIITFFGGVLVWKERDARLDEVFDALPHATWIMYIGKTISLTLIVAILLTIGWFAGVATQAINGYTRFQSQLYVTELLGLDLFRMFCLIVLSMIAHVMAPNTSATSSSSCC